MGYEAKKTEHVGAKKDSGTYWGRKVAAKKESDGRMIRRGRKRIDWHNIEEMDRME